MNPSKSLWIFASLDCWRRAQTTGEIHSIIFFITLHHVRVVRLLLYTKFHNLRIVFLRLLRLCTAHRSKRTQLIREHGTLVHSSLAPLLASWRTIAGKQLQPSNSLSLLSEPSRFDPISISIGGWPSPFSTPERPAEAATPGIPLPPHHPSSEWVPRPSECCLPPRWTPTAWNSPPSPPVPEPVDCLVVPTAVAMACASNPGRRGCRRLRHRGRCFAVAVSSTESRRVARARPPG
mmetsp:Transcript_15129/g.42071  ORF Transcript_15129/g.42071 Transcript_15129/m.42071 type:complete len:235 (+) Transcript_15129:1245-1949(+)